MVSNRKDLESYREATQIMQMQKQKCDAGRRFGPRLNGLKDKPVENVVPVEERDFGAEKDLRYDRPS